jgi:hypothetical protein
VATLVEVHVTVVAGPSGAPLAAAVWSWSAPGFVAVHGAPRCGDEERLVTTAIATTTTAKAPASRSQRVHRVRGREVVVVVAAIIRRLGSRPGIKKCYDRGTPVRPSP